MTTALVYKICEFLLIDGVKLGNKSLTYTKKILNSLVASSQTNAEVVQKFLNSKINERMRDKINSLRIRCDASQINLFGAMNLKVRAETEKI
jgi:hypothetical protein